ncbi:MAG: aspartate carbamoyltransferase catalytic subunit [Clostridiaceae bacterium]|jgi:aspartate carbamoyltransferase catalytic subunit|nr:aspartate carbamoyltransferase catalytic subunit [Bacillota bacterium]NLN51896.1 aspartate carbamoyltransferase catalytic subunit [Clostridiaceae bacterium]
MHLKSKDLLSIEQLSAEEIVMILDSAKTMKKVLTQPTKKTSHLQGKSVVNLFFENSTRTRLSFEMAAKYMGAASVNISSSGSSINKGETLLDTAVTIDMMSTDFLIMRHRESGAAEFLAKRVSASVINAGDGMHEHPTQALLDVFTMRDKLGHLDKLKVAIIGDCLHSRVFRSNLLALTKLGSEVWVSGPASLMPLDVKQTGAHYTRHVEEAIEGADVVMSLRIQLERMKCGLFPSVNEYFRYYGLDDNKIKLAKENALVMHPGPANRGVEINSALYESDQSVISEQVTNGVAIRMAILYLLNLRRNAL